MYPAYKEVPVAVLEALLAHPDDERANDALLFEGEGEAGCWSAAATRCELSDEVLAERFAGAVVPVEPDDRRWYAGIELGKYPDWEDDLPFRYFVGLGDVDRDLDLTDVLERRNPDEDVARWAALGVEPVHFRRARVTHTTAVGTEQCGFATDVVCYGISGYRWPHELAATWSWILEALARTARFRARVLARFADELRYYEGCAARRSGDLYLIW